MRARVGGKLSKPDKMGIKVKKKRCFSEMVEICPSV